MSQRSKIEEVTPQDAAGLREKGAVLLDVREPDEWEPDTRQTPSTSRWPE